MADPRVDKIRAGDVEAFSAVFAEFFGPLCVFVRGIVQHDAVAEDIVQELFVRVWQARGSLAPETSLRAYLYTGARRAALNAVRGDARSARWIARATQQDEGAPGMATATSLPDSDDPAAQREERIAAVYRVIDTLPPRVREVFILRWQQGFKYSEIAGVLEISVKTVEMHMTAAVKRIRAAIGPLFGA